MKLSKFFVRFACSFILFGVTSINAKTIWSASPPVINWTWPAAGAVVTRAVGQSITFQVSATSNVGMKYQWLKNGTVISGATSSVYTISSLMLSSAGQYRVKVSNKFGSVTSGASTLQVGTSPTITALSPSSPASYTAGQTITFSVTATGSSTLAYQWMKNGSNIAGATSSTYSIASSISADSAQYSVKVTNAYGAATSTAISVTVVAGTAPTITSYNPSSAVTVPAGQSYTFSVTAAGSSTLAYQWMKNGAAISGATSSSYTIASLASSDTANYRVNVYNSYGSVSTPNISLTVGSSSITTSSLTHYTQSAVVAKYNSSTATVSVSAFAAPRILFVGDSSMQDGFKIYVNASSGSDSTGSGSATAPYKSISAAVKTLSSTTIGAATKFNIIIGGGIYRETIDLATSKLAGTTIPLIIQSAPSETVLIKGSDIMVGWTSLGNGLFSHDYCTVNTASWRTVSPCVPIEQVVYQNQMLQQVAGTVFDGFPLNTNSSYRNAVLGLNIWTGRLAGDQTNMPDNSFYYANSLDSTGKATGKIYIKLPSTITDVSSKIIEVSTRNYVFHAGGISNVTLRNLNFEHSNTTANMSHASGAVNLLNSSNTVVDHVSIAFMDGACLSTSGWNSATGTAVDTTNVSIKGSNVAYCGHIGLSGWGSNDTIQSNSISYNNLRGFNNNWASGGIKFAGAGGIKNSIISDNDIFRNFGDGFWCDYCKVGGNTFNGNRIYYNDKFGIHFEVSTGTQFTGNYIYGNGAHGIYHRESVNTTFDGNYILWHQGYGLAVADVLTVTNGVSNSRAMSVYGVPVSGNKVTNNKIGFGNMSGANASSLMQIDWWSKNSSNYNTLINKLWGSPLSPFPWQFYGVSGSGANDYSVTTTVQANLATWQSKTGSDLNSLKYDKDPMNVTLVGDTESLYQKIQNKEPIPMSKIQDYFKLLAQ